MSSECNEIENSSVSADSPPKLKFDGIVSKSLFLDLGPSKPHAHSFPHIHPETCPHIHVPFLVLLGFS